MVLKDTLKQNFFTMYGRLPRRPFILRFALVLAVSLVIIAVGVHLFKVFAHPAPIGIMLLLLCLPFVSLFFLVTQRMHDINLHGGFIFILIAGVLAAFSGWRFIPPVGVVVTVIFIACLCIFKGSPTTNKFGHVPIIK